MTPPVNAPKPKGGGAAAANVQAHRTDFLFRRLAKMLPQT